MTPSKGLYLNRGRGAELEQMIDDLRVELGERIAAAEAKAAAAERTALKVVETLVLAARKKAA